MVQLRAPTGTHLPLWSSPHDGDKGKTTAEQQATEKEVSEYLSPYRDGNNATFPSLHRQAHLAFMSQWIRPLPAQALPFDQNRSWLIYWVLHTSDLLGMPWGSYPVPSEQKSKDVRTRATDTLLSLQNPTGGFAGGPGQNSHLMASYAAIMALAIVGGPIDGSPAHASAWDQVDRGKMYDWILSLKQPDGSFVITQGGEIDIRCTYCVLCISLALGICTPELIEGMDTFLGSCQTYEGGIASAAFPRDGREDATIPMGEAHGGYAWCAIAAMAMLIRLKQGHPSQENSVASKRNELDLSAFYRWAIHLQGTPIEGGAFKGRPNKLVDGCYGWFSGAGLFACLEAAMDLTGPKRHNANGPRSTQCQDTEATQSSTSHPPQDAHQDRWLFDSASLQEHILVCAQNDGTKGGLKDKPSSKADAYHTCYNLSALSLCQHHVVVCDDTYSALRQGFTPSSSPNNTSSSLPVRKDDWLAHCYAASLGWTIDEDQGFVLGAEQNMVMPTHPVFNVSFVHIKQMMDHFYVQV